MRSFHRRLAAGCCLGLIVGCGSSDDQDSNDGPTVVVTTNILGDIVSAAAGDLVEVEVIMPAGAEPHDFAPSARQAEAMEDADLLVVNGAGLEAGMLDVIDNVDATGTPVFSFAESVELLDGDPHLWTDPQRIESGLDALGQRLGELDGVDAAAMADSVADYLGALDALDTAIEQTVDPVPTERRVLVTNHEVFAYFADRYDFDVVGAVIPSTTTDAEPSAAEVEALAEQIREQGISVIFGETTQSTQVAEAVAAEVGDDVDIVELFSESLGDEGSGAETYLDMMQTNAELITDALRER